MYIFIIICTCINMYKIINIRCIYIYIRMCVRVSSYPHYILCIVISPLYPLYRHIPTISFVSVIH